MKTHVTVNLVEAYYGYSVEFKMNAGMFVKEDVIKAIHKRKMTSKVEAFKNEIIIFLSSRQEKNTLLNEVFRDLRATKK